MHRVCLLGKDLREELEVRAARPGCCGTDTLLGVGRPSGEDERRRGNGKTQVLHQFLPMLTRRNALDSDRRVRVALRQRMSLERIAVALLAVRVQDADGSGKKDESVISNPRLGGLLSSQSCLHGGDRGPGTYPCPWPGGARPA